MSDEGLDAVVGMEGTGGTEMAAQAAIETFEAAGGAQS